MKKTALAALFAATSFSVSSHADVIGGTIEASYWYAGYSGQFISGSEQLDLEDNLNLGDEGFTEVAASFEHPVPVLPNIRVRHINLDSSAPDGNASNINFDGLNFDGSLSTKLDLSHNDYILYYEILDNWVTIDVGIDVKQFDGELEVSENSGFDVSRTEIDEVVPMLYGAASFEMPFTGMSAGAELSLISISGDSLHDAKLRLRQNIGLAFAEIGYRQIAIDIEDVSDIDIDADISGAYISLGLDF